MKTMTISTLGNPTFSSPLAPGDAARILVPADLTVLGLTAHAFTAAFQLEKSNGELKKQFITTGSVQLNGAKLTDPNAPVSPQPGDILKLSKKHAVRFL